MFFSCCFRNQKNKKQKKKEVKLDILQENEDSLSSAAYLLSPPENSSNTIHSASLRNIQEKHPPSREGKRLLKQKSQESLHKRQSGSSNQNIVITDKSYTSTISLTTVHCRKDSLPSPPATPNNTQEHAKKYSISEGPSLSASNLLETSLTRSNSFISKTSYHKDPSGAADRTSSSAANISHSQSSSASVTHSQASIDTIRHYSPEDNVVGGIKRSSAFHDAELLEKQIKNEEEAQRKRQEDNLISQIRKEYELTIQALKEENRLSLLKANESYNSELQTEKLRQRNEHEEAILRTKRKASESISKINQQIVLERAKVIAEQQEKGNQLEEQYKEKELKLNESFNRIEERDLTWQDERADILKEVQRLKAEATKMIKILAMEYEEDSLSEDKKRSLSQEVYSLQLVVEMKTGEVRTLREQLNKAVQQMEESDLTKEKLEKATARMEDLEEQLKLKDEIEMQLSVEKSQMEKTVMNSNKAAQRMSQNVEELQWRIRNNFELPVEVFSSKNNQNGKKQSNQKLNAWNLKSLHDSTEDPLDEGYLQLQTSPSPSKKSDSQSRKKSFFNVSPEMLQATSLDENISDKCVKQGATSDFSPSSEEVAKYVIEETPEKEDGVYLHNNSDEIDGDSLDEGLGDISSDGETSQSPEPNNTKNNNKFNNQLSHNFKTCEQALKPSANSPETDGVPYISRISPEKERRPSRMSFETPL